MKGAGLALLFGAASSTTLPALRPRKNTIACADPLAAQDFTLKYIGGLWTEQKVDGGDGSCADIKWVNFSPWDPDNKNNTQFHWHFVETSRKPTGPMSLIQLHGYMEWLHGNLSLANNPADELADSHMTLSAGSLDPFAELYRKDGVPFSARARKIPDEDLTLYSVLVRVGKGGFNVTSTCEFSDEICQGKGPLFENSTRDELLSNNESKRVKTDRDTSLER